MKINVVPHDPNWSNQFKLEKNYLTKFLADQRLEIEHVGSTAVVGLESQPIIDIMIGTPDLASLNSLATKFATDVSYIYCHYREETFPSHRFFIKIDPTNLGLSDQIPKVIESSQEMPVELLPFLRFQILALEKKSTSWEKHLLFRRLLQKNPIVREQYGQLKSELARLDWENQEEYGTAKADFIQGCIDGMRRS